MFGFSDPVQEKLAGPDAALSPRHSRKRQVKFLDFHPSRLFSFGEDVAQFLSPVVRPVRQQARRPAPVYPPFDPFNTTYIPLPGEITLYRNFPIASIILLFIEIDHFKATMA